MAKTELILSKLRTRIRNDPNMCEWMVQTLVHPPVSLRCIEWLSSSYSRRNDVSYYVPKPEGGRTLFHLHSSYKSQIKAYTRKNFDPFKRKTSVSIFLPSMAKTKQSGDQVESTVSQINFFRWVYDYNVLQYATKHSAEILHDIEHHEHRRSNVKKGQSKGGGGSTSSNSKPKSTPTPKPKTVRFSLPHGTSTIKLSFA